MTVVDAAPGLVASARLMGHERWLALRTFETLGGWLHSTPEPEAKRLFGTHCPIYAWHAELWLERIPAIPDVTPASVTAPQPAQIASAVEAVRAATDTIERLVGIYRVLVPHNVAAHSAWRGVVDPMLDAPTARTLDLIVRDEVEASRAGEALLRSLVVTPEQARAAALRQAELEALLVSARAASPTSGAARGTATRS